MTLFEYLSVAISIVLALSTAQLLGNLREVFDPARRYWVHALWVVQILLTHFIFWWGFWAYREVESWNLGFFGLALLNPVLLFVCSNVLVRGQPSDGASWEKHFFSARRWFFAARGAIAVVAQLRVWVLFAAADAGAEGDPRAGDDSYLRHRRSIGKQAGSRGVGPHRSHPNCRRRIYSVPARTPHTRSAVALCR